MRVFILGTGRCGSVSLIEACKYITNFTSGHESQVSLTGPSRFDYPDFHIESDNRLSWFPGQLHERYGDEAIYVHLKRNRDKTARSFANRFYGGRSIIMAFSSGYKMTIPKKISPEEQLEICYDYVDAVHSNVDLFISQRPGSLTMELENIKEDFIKFWDLIGAEGDKEQALKVFETPKNVSTKKQRRKFKLFPYYKVLRVWRRLKS